MRGKIVPQKYAVSIFPRRGVRYRGMSIATAPGPNTTRESAIMAANKYTKGSCRAAKRARSAEERHSAPKRSAAINAAAWVKSAGRSKSASAISSIPPHRGGYGRAAASSACARSLRLRRRCRASARRNRESARRSTSGATNAYESSSGNKLNTAMMC